MLFRSSNSELGTPSTSIAALRELEGDIPRVLIELSSIDQMLETFITKLPTYIQEDGRIHASINQAGNWEDSGKDGEAPETRRFALSGPNLNQITHHGDEGRPYVAAWGQQLRRCFVPREGWVWVKFDFSKVEPRLAAMISNDPVYLHDTSEGDMYKEAAAIAFGVPVLAINHEQRQVGKKMHMAWMNRARAQGIQKSAHWMSDRQALRFCLAMDDRYSVFTQWHKDLIAQARRDGFVRTWFGAKCLLPTIWSSNDRQRAAAEREVVPLVVSGTAAGVLKLALQRLFLYLEDKQAKALFPIHDEVALECPPEELEALLEVCYYITKDIVSVVLPVEVSFGSSWADQIPWEPGRRIAWK